MIKSFKLFLAMVFGTTIGFFAVTTLIEPMSFGKYFCIEAVISILHAVYERTKSQIVNI